MSQNCTGFAQYFHKRLLLKDMRILNYLRFGVEQLLIFAIGIVRRKTADEKGGTEKS